MNQKASILASVFCLSVMFVIFGCGGGNNPPNTPEIISPADGATNQALDVDLNWSCSDPDGDQLTYDIFFGTASTPPSAATNVSNTVFDPGSLGYFTKYYWEIRAVDEMGDTTSSDVWSFTTIQPPERWFSYDDGGFEDGITCSPYGYLVVRFSRPQGWPALRVSKVKIYLYSGATEEFDISAYDDFNVGGSYCWPAGPVMTLKSNVTQNTGWFEHDVSQHFYSSEFFVGIYNSDTSSPYLGDDQSPDCAKRSYYKFGTSNWNIFVDGHDFGVQVYVNYVSGSLDGKVSEKGMWLKPSDRYLMDKNGVLIKK